jgi:phthalate 4,5-dioxygenase
MLLEAAKAYRQHGKVPATVSNPDLSMVRAVSLQLTPEESWSGPSGRQHMTAELGKGFGYTP